jgi:quercetin dioxygenase-like cupin family protein
LTKTFIPSKQLVKRQVELTIVAPGGGSPLHRHNEEDESFYVQEGEIEFQLDDRILVATAFCLAVIEIEESDLDCE